MERLEKLMSEYLEYCRQRKNLNGKTLKAYRIDLRQYAGFIDSIGGMGCNGIILILILRKFISIISRGRLRGRRRV